MYSASSSRLGSDSMPLRLSVLTWYWSMTHSTAERLPRHDMHSCRMCAEDMGQEFRRFFGVNLQLLSAHADDNPWQGGLGPRREIEAIRVLIFPNDE